MTIEQLCATTGTNFEISAEDIDFYRRISPTFNGRRFEIPVPTLSPVERQRRRLSFRNIRNLYRRKCDLSGRPIVSCYPSDSPHKIYHSEQWWSDSWDALSYGRDFDFNRPFFEQFHSLYQAVPIIHLYQTPNENCEFINGASNCRNCYLSFLMDYCEDCYYLTVGNIVRSSLDSFGLTRCELCYECVDCSGCYSLMYSDRCSGCSDSFFLSSCRECRNCIGCCNLVGKEYCVFNQYVGKEKYKEIAATFSSAKAVQLFRSQFEKFSSELPRRFYFGQANESFSGDNISNVRNSYWCFDAKELDNCRHCNFFFNSDNSMDVNYFGDKSSWLYECLATGLNCSNNSFCMLCWSGSSNNLYCHLVSGTSNCFGCSGLKQKQFCILNKQYTQPEYERLAARIAEHMQNTGEWGEFFPSNLSPFAVNVSQAQDYFPISEAEAAERKLTWREREKKPASNAPVVNSDTIAEFPESLINKAFSCHSCQGDFKIIEPEYRFYQTNGVPPPVTCPECRHQSRAKLRNPGELWERACSKCSAAIMTAYSPENPATVYCAECYAAHVY